MSIEVLPERFFDLPPAVRIAALKPGAQHAGDPELLQVPIPASLELAVPARILEYRLGRIAAARALSDLGMPDAPPPGRDSTGVPIWEPGFAGSITHTRGFVAAAVASLEHIEAIGIDAEAFVTRERLDAASQVALTDGDRKIIRDFARGRTEEIHGQLLLAMVSAKESVTKCLGFPLGMQDFREIRLEDLDESSPERVTARFALHSGTFTTSITFDSERVYSCCWVPAEASPS